MKSVQPFVIPETREFQFIMPIGSRVLSLGVTKEGPCLWVLYDDLEPRAEDVQFVQRYALSPVPTTLPLHYVGSYRRGPMIDEVSSHVFRLGKPVEPKEIPPVPAGDELLESINGALAELNMDVLIRVLYDNRLKHHLLSQGNMGEVSMASMLLERILDSHLTAILDQMVKVAEEHAQRYEAQ
jgi:hypothetical protein